MLRLSVRGIAALTAVVAMAVGSTAPAYARAAKEPHLDRAPRAVGFRATAVLLGHLKGFTPGDEVTLQRRLPGGSWRARSTRRVDDAGRVRLRRTRLRVTARYRLAYTDPATGTTAVSDPRKIRVRPRLRFAPARRHILRGGMVKVSGSLYPKKPGRRVVVQRKVAGEWRYAAKVSVRDGGFVARFEAHHAGFRRLRAVFRGDAHNLRREARAAVRVYRRSRATWYGPGFYGNRTACGKTLTTETLGVAHRTLPCGTKVHVLYEGRTIAVPVIDRGPYANRANWDLTQETAERLRFSGVDTIGVTVGG